MNRCCTPPHVGGSSPSGHFSHVRHRLFVDEEEHCVPVARQLGMEDDRSSTFSSSLSDPQNDALSREDTCVFNASRTRRGEPGSSHVTLSPTKGRDRSHTQLFIDTEPDAEAGGRTAALGLLSVPMNKWYAAAPAAQVSGTPVPAPLAFSPQLGVFGTTVGDRTPTSCQTPQPHRILDPGRACDVTCPFPQRTGAVGSLLCTPQVAPALVAMRHQLDVELDETNRLHRIHPLPPVTTLIAGQLYIGGYPDDVTLSQLRQIGVRHIINCCAGEYHSNPALAPDFSIHDIDAFDSPDYLILHHDYDRFNDLVSRILGSGESVFVHCVAGVNRSVTLCAAFIIEHSRLTPIEVVQLFRANQRMRILENVSFRHQLVDHYVECVTHQQNEEDL